MLGATRSNKPFGMMGLIFVFPGDDVPSSARKRPRLRRSAMASFYWEANPGGPFATLIAVAATYLEPENYDVESLGRLAKRPDDREMSVLKEEFREAIRDLGRLPGGELFRQRRIRRRNRRGVPATALAGPLRQRAGHRNRARGLRAPHPTPPGTGRRGAKRETLPASEGRHQGVAEDFGRPSLKRPRSPGSGVAVIGSIDLVEQR